MTVKLLETAKLRVKCLLEINHIKIHYPSKQDVRSNYCISYTGAVHRKVLLQISLR